MLLAVDIGNSDIVLGVHHQNKWLLVWRLKSIREKSSSDFEVEIRTHFLENNVKISDIQRSVLSSVVPVLTPTLKKTLFNLFGLEPLTLGPEVYPKIKIGIERPNEIGADLVANAIAAHTRYQKNCLVVDFGTALTFTTVSGDGKILGVAIAPGLKTAMKALFTHTAQLPEVPLQYPLSPIGKNTEQAIQAGVLMGYAGLVKYMIEQIKNELNGDCVVIATGGLSSVLSPLKEVFEEIDPMLTLNGLCIIDEYYRQS